MRNFGLVFLVLSNLLAGEYFLSFSFSTKNYKIISYQINCSKVLTNISGYKKLLFSFNTSYNNIEEICKFEKDKIFNHLLKLQLSIYSLDKTYNNSLKSYKKLVFLPKRFDIIIKNGIAYFYLKE